MAAVTMHLLNDAVRFGHQKGTRGAQIIGQIEVDSHPWVAGRHNAHPRRIPLHNGTQRIDRRIHDFDKHFAPHRHRMTGLSAKQRQRDATARRARNRSDRSNGVGGDQRVIDRQRDNDARVGRHNGKPSAQTVHHLAIAAQKNHLHGIGQRRQCSSTKRAHDQHAA